MVAILEMVIRVSGSSQRADLKLHTSLTRQPDHFYDPVSKRQHTHVPVPEAESPSPSPQQLGIIEGKDLHMGAPPSSQGAWEFPSKPE